MPENLPRAGGKGFRLSGSVCASNRLWREPISPNSLSGVSGARPASRRRRTASPCPARRAAVLAHAITSSMVAIEFSARDTSPTSQDGVVGLGHVLLVSLCFRHLVKFGSYPALGQFSPSALRGNVFTRIFGRWRGQDALNEHRWHRLPGFHAQSANALPDRKRVALPCRESFHRFVVGA